MSRHNALRDALYSTAVAASLGPSREGRFLLPGDDRRPADVLIPHWTGGQDTAWDVTVIHPLQAATVAGAAASPGHALEVAVKRKNRGALEDCQRQGIKFIPLAVESLGGWHELGNPEAGGCTGETVGSRRERGKGSPAAAAVSFPDEGKWGSFCKSDSRQHRSQYRWSGMNKLTLLILYP